MTPVLRLFLLAVCVSVSAAPALPQDPLIAFPKNYKLILDNDDVSVIRVHYDPHEKIGVHDHSKFPTIYVYLDDAGQVRFTHDETPPFIMARPPVKQGSFRISPGRVERHSVENQSDQSSDFLRIELKKIPLENTLHPVRGTVPATLVAGVEEAVSAPELTIQRIVCRQTPCVGAASAPTLLVAISPASITTPNHPGIDMKPGEVLWLSTAQPLQVEAESGVPAHLLQISLHRPAK